MGNVEVKELNKLTPDSSPVELRGEQNVLKNDKTHPVNGRTRCQRSDFPRNKRTL